MKIPITTHDGQVIDLTGLSEPCAIKTLHRRLHSTQEMVSAMRYIIQRYPTFDMASALTMHNMNDTSDLEYVVRCVQRSEYQILDLIFDSALVSVNYVSTSKSPLILYAMQTGEIMFRYLLSRGAQLIINDDFARNTIYPHVTSLFCANGNNSVLNVLFNVMLTPAGAAVKNKETIAGLLQFGIIIGRDKYELRKYAKIHTPDTVILTSYPPQNPPPVVIENSPIGRVLSLVRRQCDAKEQYLSAGQGCSHQDIRLAISTAMSIGRMAPFWALCDAFPECQIK